MNTKSTADLHLKYSELISECLRSEVQSITESASVEAPEKPITNIKNRKGDSEQDDVEDDMDDSDDVKTKAKKDEMCSGKGSVKKGK